MADNNALLLRNTDLVRFQPNADWNGTVAAGITFRAWDRTSGTQGTYVDTTTNGGTTAFSTATETASLVVNATPPPPPPPPPPPEEPPVEEPPPEEPPVEEPPSDEPPVEEPPPDEPPVEEPPPDEPALVEPPSAPAPRSDSGSSAPAPSSTDSPAGTTDAGSTLSTDSGGDISVDAGNTSFANEAADGGDATDVGESTDAGDAADTGDAADGERSTSDGGAQGSGRAGVGRAANDVGYHERDDEQEWGASRLTAEITDAMFNDELLRDESQPLEFREAWDTILGAYAESSEEVSAYLESAFRAVTESAVTYRAAEQSIEVMNQELALAAEYGLLFDADGLRDEIREARDDVKIASQELERAILAAAEVGKSDKFDRVLEDVVSGALQRLMTANGRLFVETQILTATATILRDARIGGERNVDDARMASATDQARVEAQATVLEMRESWDRVARDVFSAFVQRLATEQGDAAEAKASG